MTAQRTGGGVPPVARSAPARAVAVEVDTARSAPVRALAVEVNAARSIPARAVAVEWDAVRSVPSYVVSPILSRLSSSDVELL